MWTENIKSVFGARIPFPNLFGLMWTGPQSANCINVFFFFFFFFFYPRSCLLLLMDDLQGTNLTVSLSSNISTSDTGTGLTTKTYVFPLVSPPTRVTFFVLLVLVGIVELIGNILIVFFLKSRKKTASLLRACTFQQNFDFYIKSLAISDALCALTANPSVCVQFYFNIFQQELACKAVRYVHILFRSVSINNLLVINIGKYFSTRKVPRTFRHSTVRKQVWFAWVAPVFYAIIPAATFKTVLR